MHQIVLTYYNFSIIVVTEALPTKDHKQKSRRVVHNRPSMRPMPLHQDAHNTAIPPMYIVHVHAFHELFVECFVLVLSP